MTRVLQRKPIDGVGSEAYEAWIKTIECIDCKATHASIWRRWSSEIQCWECWASRGPPEKRGRLSALDTFTEWKAARCNIY